jgi:hypothetical protein
VVREEQPRAVLSRRAVHDGVASARELLLHEGARRRLRPQTSIITSRLRRSLVGERDTCVRDALPRDPSSTSDAATILPPMTPVVFADTARPACRLLVAEVGIAGSPAGVAGTAGGGSAGVVLVAFGSPAVASAGLAPSGGGAEEVRAQRHTGCGWIATPRPGRRRGGEGRWQARAGSAALRRRTAASPARVGDAPVKDGGEPGPGRRRPGEGRRRAWPGSAAPRRRTAASPAPGGGAPGKDGGRSWPGSRRPGRGAPWGKRRR